MGWGLCPNLNYTQRLYKSFMWKENEVVLLFQHVLWNCFNFYTNLDVLYVYKIIFLHKSSVLCCFVIFYGLCTLFGTIVLNTALFDIERVNERNSNMEVKADPGAKPIDNCDIGATVYGQRNWRKLDQQQRWVTASVTQLECWEWSHRTQEVQK